MMRIKNLILVRVMGMAIVMGLILTGCGSDITTSPQPGTLIVTLHSDPADTQIVILSKIFTVSDKDYFGTTIFQGKIFSGDKFAFLYKDKNSYRQEDVTYNIIERKEGQYTQVTIFDSYVPPGDYTNLQFGVTGSLVKIGYLEIPVKLPAGTTPMRDLEQNFKVYENQVTEINIQISPFKSVKRYRDAYQFIPEMKIIDLSYR